MRFRARLESQTPLPSGADAEQLRQQVQQYIWEAERCDPSESEELVSRVVDQVARDFFRHRIQKKRSRTV
jgi:hypothetical protein